MKASFPCEPVTDRQEQERDGRNLFHAECVNSSDTGIDVNPVLAMHVAVHTSNGCQQRRPSIIPLAMLEPRTTLTALPLELIDHILAFLSWPTDIHSLLLVNKFLSPISERNLYRHIGDLPARRAVRLLLSLANAPATRCALVKSLSLNFSDNRVLFALELLIAKVLRLLPRLRSLNVEVSIHENRYRALAWIFPRDTPFRLRSFATSIRSVSFPHPFLPFSSPRVTLSELTMLWQARPRSSNLPRVSTRDP